MEDKHSRAEYLKALLNQKKILSANGESFVNPSVPNNLSYLAQANPSEVDTSSYAPKSEKTPYKKVMDTASLFVHDINKGIVDYILDPLFDSGAWVYGALSGNQEQAKNAMNYEWGEHYLNVIDFLDFGTNLLSGDMFTADYYQNIAETGNLDKVKENTAQLENGTYQSQEFRQGTQIVGSLLPSIILGIATGGSSAGVQATALGIQAGISGTTAFGRSTKEALDSGADYYKAGGYGAVRGITSAGLTLAGGKIAGSLFNGGVGSTIGNKVLGKTGSVLLSKIVKVGVNAGLDGVEAAIDEAVVKPATQLIYDQEAWAKAYGSTSATYETLTKAGQAAITATALSAFAQTANETGQRLKLGKEGYTKNALNEYDYSVNKKKYNELFDKMNKVVNGEEMQTVLRQLKAYELDLTNGNISETEYVSKVKPLIEQFDKYQSLANSYAQQLEDLKIDSGADSKYGGAIRQERRSKIDEFVKKTNIKKEADNVAIHKNLSALFDEGWTFDDIKQEFTNKTQKVNVNGNGKTFYQYENNRIPLLATNDDGMAFEPTTSKQKVNSILLLGSNVKTPAKVASFDAKSLNDGVDGDIIVSKKVAKQILTETTPEQLEEFFDITKDHKAGSVSNKNGLVIYKNYYKSDDGENLVAKTIVDEKTNQLKSFTIANTAKDDSVTQEYFNNEPRYVKAYGDLNHERILSLNKAEDIFDIVKKQIIEKSKSKGDTHEYSPKLLKGITSKRLFEMYNTLGKDEIKIEIDNIADDIANADMVATSQDGLKTTFKVGHKEYIVEVITELLEAKSELSRIERIKQRNDISLAKKDEQIARVREIANKHLTEAYERLAEVRKQLSSIAKEYKERIAPSRTLRGYKIKLPKLFNKNLEFTEDNISYRMGSLLASPFLKLVSNEYGYNSGELKGGELFKDALQKVLNEYTEDKVGEESIFPYDEGLRNNIQTLINELPEPRISEKGKVSYPSLTASNLRLVNKIVGNIEKLAKAAKKNYEEILIPKVSNAKNAIKNQNTKAVKEILLNPYSFNAASSFAITNAILGGSSLARDITVGMQIANSDRIIYFGNRLKPIEDKLKELKIINEQGKTIKYKGEKIPLGHLVDTYASLKSGNFDLLNKNGYKYINERGKSIVLVEKGKAQETLDYLEKILSKPNKDFAMWLLEHIYNGTAREDFIGIEKEKGLTEIAISANYYSLNAKVAKMADVHAMVKAPRLFKRDLERVEHDHEFVSADATMRVMQLFNDLSIEKHLRPVYKENYRIFNYKRKGETSIYEDIYDTNPKYAQYINDTLNSWMFYVPGIKGGLKNFASYLTSNYSSKLLAFNVGTVARQGLSLTMSNFTLPKIFAGYYHRVFGSKKFKEEFNGLVQDISQVLYRSKDIEISISSNPIFKALKITNDIGMAGIKFADDQTTKTGLAVAMVMTKDLGYELGTEEFRTTAKELFLTNFASTQMGSEPVNKSRLSTGKSPLGEIGKILTFMQGDAQGALGAFVDRINTAMLVKGWDDTKVKNDIETAEKELQSASKVKNEKEQELEELYQRQEQGEDLEEEIESAEEELNKATEDFINAKAKEEQAQTNKKTWEKYKAMGGKTWAISAVLNLLVTSVLFALVEDFASKMKGRESWNNFDSDKFTKNALMYGTLGWAPIFNTISNALQGYDTSYPTGAIISDFTSLIASITNAVKNGLDESSIKALISDAVNVISLVTGWPIKNIESLINGILMTFDPEKAYHLNNVFYQVSPNHTTKEFNELIEKGEYEFANDYLNFVMVSFKGMASNDKISNEIVELTRKGYRVMPKNIISSYTTDNGEIKTFSEQQEKTFNKLYSQAEKVVESTIKTSFYNSADDELQATILQKIYDAYYSYAKAKTLNVKADSRLGQLLVLTNGDIHLALYIMHLQKIANLVANDKQTKKEQVVNYVNKLSNLSKNEKLLLLTLAGYSVNKENKQAFTAYLSKFGAGKKEIEDFIS